MRGRSAIPKTKPLAVLAAAFVLATGAGAQSPVAGSWVGDLRLEEAVQQFAVSFESTDGALTAYIDIPERGIRAKRLREVEVTDEAILFMLPLPRSAYRFRGVLAGAEIRGTAHEFGWEGPLGEEASFRLERVEPAEPPMRVSTFRFVSDGISLVGDLMLPPAGAPPYPAVVFVHGSGGMERAFFRFYAEALARAGFASLAYDKRGAGESGGDWRTADYSELAGDVVAAVEALGREPRIDRTRVGLWGSSQAGWVVPLAAGAAELRFAVLVSPGAPIPPRREFLWDFEHRLRSAGFTEREVSLGLELIESDLEVSRTGEGLEALRARVSEVEETEWYSAMGWWGPLELDHWSRARVRRTMDHDPAPSLARLDLPVLWVFGAADGSVPVHEAVPLVLSAAREAGSDFTLLLVPGADHLLLRHSESPSPFRWPVLAPELLQVAVPWMASHVRSGGAREP